FLIGGVPRDFGVSARLGKTPLFVIEADEYDTAFCDKRSKFVHYRSRTVILNNLEFDHADIFADLAAIETQFHHLVRTLPVSGRIVANARDENLKRVLARGCWTPVDWFNAWKGGWGVDGDDVDGSLVIYDDSGEIGRAHWQLTGAHNRANACAALLAARHVGVALADGLEALSGFQNVKRRLEIRGEAGGVKVYDDFAHHPTAIEATLDGLRRKVGLASRIFVVLEPRSNTMKMGTMKDKLAASLRQADRVFCYCANLGWDAAAVLSPLGDRQSCHDELAALVAAVAAEARPGDHVLAMSNGGFGGVHQKLLDALAAA
ncbi:MAG: UDP-N-acetylmuramate:L-alanyl-gamma-D-glutamyl-meso-diaminopimelate ligase, partial [Azoarcus sp.]|nr:UDP-N-acetylmuramate:L-alanyl-gamma-D-glutamyl-meso-diaminopimelate ligase [Azoarcus sp.]